MTKFLLNGEVADHIALADRGLQYGDGFFTTLRVVNGEIKLWPLHWQRLHECARRLGFAHMHELRSEQQLLADCARLLELEQPPAEECVLRITVTRGSGGRGYAPPTQPQCNILLALSPMPAHYAGWRAHGISLLLSQLRLGDQPMLNGLKTLNRLEQVLLKQELVTQQRTHDIDDILVLDQRGFVAESSAANILWYKDDSWYSPALSHGGVRGVMLQALSQELPLVQGDFALPHLLEAEHVMVCNALMGAVSVQRLVIDSTTERHFSVLSEASNHLIKRICANE